MSSYATSKWSRRQIIKGLSASAAAGLLGLGPGRAVAEPPPETTTIRLIADPILPVVCYAPQLVAEQFLRMEGFTDISYSKYDSTYTEASVLGSGDADMSAAFASDYLVAIDAGKPISIIGGVHVGCTELFAGDQVKTIRDLSGKRVLISAIGGPEYILLSTIAAQVGLNAQRDFEWVEDTDFTKWPDLLKSGEVDAIATFPPMSYELHDRKIGHVVLNTVSDDPWRHYFCCMLGARTAFVKNYPVATKRAIRAMLKANALCSQDPQTAAALIDRHGEEFGGQELIFRSLKDIPYDAWRNYDLEASLRFYALRLHEAGLVNRTPNELLKLASDFRMFEQLRLELKA